MRLERLISEINGEMYKKIVENRSVKDTDAEKTAEIVGLFRDKVRGSVQPGFKGLCF